MDYNLDELQWKCLTCAEVAAVTHSDYMKFIKHAPGKKHQIRLVHKGTGEVLATNPKGAFGKGILVPGYIPKAKEKTPKASSPETQNPGISDNPFTPSGLATDVKSPQWLTIGTFRMPFEDWGYSSARNLLMVAETYSQAKVEYGFDVKVGDFCAQLCRAFRMLKGWDLIGAGYSENQISEGEG